MLVKLSLILSIKGDTGRQRHQRVQCSHLVLHCDLQVQSLLMELCDETSIAELQLKVKDLELQARIICVAIGFTL